MNKKLEAVIKIVKTNTVALGPWTVVEVIDETGLKGFGASHKSKQDKWNADMGRGIALGRAKRDLYNKMNKVKTGNRSVFVG
jgi:hypothetical protein